MITNVLIWKTCRVLANEARLRILYRLMCGVELCVTDIAAAEGMTSVVASQHLRLLHETGFLKQTRESKWTFYAAASDPELLLARKIYKPLKMQLTRNKNQIPKLLRSTTAFTHPRRIEIVKQLNSTSRTFAELMSVCAISSRAMTRHLEKLRSRNLIQKNSETYCLVSGGTELEKALISLCLKSD
jgi:DNA-binding transcriptional ArsR family regulator